jgi:hypothetical protein
LCDALMLTWGISATIITSTFTLREMTSSWNGQRWEPSVIVVVNDGVLQYLFRSLAEYTMSHCLCT